MTDPQPAPPADVSRPNSRRVMIIIAIVCAVLFAGYLYLDSRKARNAMEEKFSEQVTQNAELLKKLANLEEVKADKRAAELYRHQEQAIAINKALRAVETGKLAKERITELSRAFDAWQKARNTVVASQDGRRIASDWKLVERIDRILKEKLPAKDATIALTTRLEALIQPVEHSVQQKNSDYVPSNDLIASIEEIQTAATDGIEQLQRATRDLAAVVKEASALPPHEELTLESALANIQDNRDKERRDREAEALAVVEREGNDKLAKQKAESQRLIDDATREAEKLAGEQAAKRIVADALTEKSRQEEELRKKQEAAAKAALEAEFARALPEIRTHLGALISSGLAYRKDGPEGPMSFAELQKRGAFREGRTGMEALMYLATISNDRPKGSIPTYIGGDNGWQLTNTPELRRAHELLRKYGKLMLEKGMLAE